jgi:hypothetical protein
MFDGQKRKEELRNIYNTMVTVDAKNNDYRWTTREEKMDIIISQERSMIEQAEKKAREEFAEKLKVAIKNRIIQTTGDNIFIGDIDKLLKEYGE